MVRSILRSALLTRYSSLRFLLMLLGVCVLLASGPIWLGTADFDYQFGYNGQVDELSFQQQTQTTPYRQLDAGTKRIVDNAIDGQSYSFEDDTRSLPKYVSRDGTFYGFTSRRAIDWANPGSFVPILTALAGFWLIFEAVQHERRQLGPHGY
ncbi:hypothetical protein MUK72_07485 [Halococcus dombrowskii]|uniref:Uncharacterized protein n=1 Tax=Halococcus dombrowskii TaxID=179637 RepID=A0AAV3SKI0_HALDO|nr:hypothetical protein [Halococcus dombrowskii]UOO93815.1 hypothetical protein MUK72_07485 [Halococcus dombrowskii]